MDHLLIMCHVFPLYFKLRVHVGTRIQLNLFFKTDTVGPTDFDCYKYIVFFRGKIVLVKVYRNFSNFLLYWEVNYV